MHRTLKTGKNRSGIASKLRLKPSLCRRYVQLKYAFWRLSYSRTNSLYFFPRSNRLLQVLQAESDVTVCVQSLLWPTVQPCWHWFGTLQGTSSTTLWGTSLWELPGKLLCQKLLSQWYKNSSIMVSWYRSLGKWTFLILFYSANSG